MCFWHSHCTFWNMERLFTTIALSLLLGLGSLSGQNRDFGNGLQIGGSLQMGLPQNEFSQVFSGYPTGLGVGATLPMGKSGLFRFGGEFSWNSMGREKTLVEIYGEAEEVVSGDLFLESNMHNFHALMRFSPFSGGFRPYFDVFFGMRSYETSTELSYETSNDVIITQSYKPSGRDWTNSYGYSAGLMIALGRNVFIDGRIQIMRGGEIDYVDQETLSLNVDGEINYNIEVTEADMLVPQLGISVVF